MPAEQYFFWLWLQGLEVAGTEQVTVSGIMSTSEFTSLDLTDLTRQVESQSSSPAAVPLQHKPVQVVLQSVLSCWLW